jgi:Acyl-protein synthetase, LuxE
LLLIPTLEEEILQCDGRNFNALALKIFQFQYSHVAIYKAYCNLMGKMPETVISIEQIPFLPIQFFKTQKVIAEGCTEQAVFESSGTTNSINSKHFVAQTSLYQKSFMRCFTQQYGNPSIYCIIGLLPSYLERGNSSLVYMVDYLIKQSQHKHSGFYLNNFSDLHKVLQQNESVGQATLLFGVTYALLDFAEAYPMPLQHTIVIETGGMKGRKKELLRTEVHQIFQRQLKVNAVHSEYGMTELLSQAYSTGKGIFTCPAHMRIVLREEDDPTALKAPAASQTGCINIMDLANLYSCSFIATDDVGKLYENGQFEVTGRLQNSDIRGCGLMVSSY